MTIQIIGSDWGKRTDFPGVVQSSLSSPRSLDEFDVNIIDLSCQNMWRNDENSFSYVNESNDLLSIKQMVGNSEKTNVVYVLPRNHVFHYYIYAGTAHKNVIIKDHLDSIRKNILNSAITPQLSGNSLYYENTRTAIAGVEYEADLYFKNYPDILTTSKMSNKVTTVSLHSRVLATALDITRSYQKLTNFVSFFFAKAKTSDFPNWFSDISFYDDCLQNDIIVEREKEIARAKQAIEEANEKLRKNNRYKSILYTNGEELVQVVFDMLEQLLACNLSEFEDVKNEDFLIRVNGHTLIGEIKGVTSNVKNDHVGQIEHHYQRYMDDLDEKGITETVHQLLIISPFRTKAPNVREPVHEKQINLAKRNGCLIIETTTLLKLFEAFLQGRVTTEQCIETICNTTGLLQISDFPVEQHENLDAFTV